MDFEHRAAEREFVAALLPLSASLAGQSAWFSLLGPKVWDLQQCFHVVEAHINDVEEMRESKTSDNGRLVCGACRIIVKTWSGERPRKP